MKTIYPEPAACWIWPRPTYNAQNAFAGFRHDFDLAALPSAAPLVITADQGYRLYVNGKYVCRGPLRGHQKNWHYDTTDIRSYLKIGKNWIAAEVHNPGISHYSYTYQGRAGFLCSARWDNGTVIATNAKDWMMFRNSAYNSYTGRLSSQMGFQEEIDLNLDDRSWITEETGWQLPPQLEWAIPNEFPQGSLPWQNLVQRPTEMLEEKLMTPESILAFGFGKCRTEPPSIPFQENNFFADFYKYELASIEYQKTAPETADDSTGMSFTVPAAGNGRFAVLLFDLGRLEWLPGSARLEYTSGEKGITADLLFLNHLTHDWVEIPADPRLGSQVAPGCRIHLRPGSGWYETFQIAGTRYAVLIVRNHAGPVRIRFSWRSAVSPIHVKGSFRCSDGTLNAIYGLSVHTQRTCTMDAFVDTPWREQSQWWGDIRIQAKNVIFLSGDTRIFEQGIRSIAGQPGPEGLLFANAPTTACGPVLPDYCLTWIHTLYDFWFQTGRTDLFLENKQRVESILDYFERQRGADGLIRYDKRFWLFEDWAPLPKRNTPAFLNLLYIYTRIHYRVLLEAAGFTAEAAALKVRLEEEKIRAGKAFLDPAEGLLVPELDENGRQTGVPSVHDQVLALLSGIAPEAEQSMIEKRILPCLRSELSDDVALPSSFWATYLIQAAWKYHFEKEALEYLRHGWEPMLNVGTAWEHFTEKHTAGASVCHAWSGHPLYHLPELLFGLKQLEPAWKKIAVEPVFLLPSAELVLPTEAGLIRCSWKAEGKKTLFNAEIPAGIIAEIRLPGETRTASGQSFSAIINR